MVQLNCSHSICKSCAAQAASHGLGNCPCCRKDHTLDIDALRQRVLSYRSVAMQNDARAGLTVPLANPSN
jgi:hypothetical protein